MTLFSARPWWSAPGGGVCDKGCLCIANINNDPSTGNKIILGSYTGVLQIYCPQPPEPKPEDLLLEVTLPAAVIQVAAGHFLQSNPALVQLAVLHPRSFAVYNVAGTAATAISLEKVFEYQMKRNASSFVLGRFGGSAVDIACVLSMDGMLQFFSKESFLFARPIPSFLLPGPLAYVAATDSIVTGSAACTVDSYRYLVLQAAGETEDAAQPQKRVKADWSLNLGEHAVDICAGPDATDCIMIMGDRSLFWLGHGGALKACKRLVSPPRSLTIYGAVDGDVRALVGTSESTVMVLCASRIVWAAHVDHDPVCLAVARLGSADGIITSVDESGALSCWYLGTDPSMPVVAHPQQRDIDYEEADRELRSIQKAIRGNLTGEAVVAEPVDVVSISTQLVRIRPARGDGVPASVDFKVEVLHAGPGILADTCVRIVPPVGWAIDSPDFPLPELGEDYGDTAEISASVHADGRLVPHGLVVEASLAYMTNKGQPRVVSAVLALPFSALCVGTQASKTAIYKVTIAASCPQPSLVDLFGDIACPSFTPTAIGLRFFCGPEVTVVASKGRYRIQSDQFAILHIVTAEVERRLRGTQLGCEITYQEELPLPDLFILVDQHFQLRTARAQAHAALEEQTKLYRGVQKRLLARYKDNTPAPLDAVYALLQAAQDKIMELADRELEAADSIALASNRLSSGLRLLALLLRLQLKLEDSQTYFLESALCVDCTDTLEQGWEECLLSSLTHLCKTSLAKGVPETLVNPQKLALPEDPSRIRKALATVCDRLKGAKIAAQ
eukprot:m.35499 g.35499  ORF g.35499 m.35499 type:complete len:786 (-) comp9599_c0_seq1:25-2382(-)